MKKNNKTYKKIEELHNWSKNPRSISAKGFDRLKKQIKELGQYKPLIVTQDGEVLGGNMRLKAYKELNIGDIWVSIVSPKNEDEKLKYALSDNDRAGFYDDDLIANLIPEYPDFKWEDFSVDLKEPTNLTDLINQFSEVEEDEAPVVQEGEVESKLGEVYQLGRHRVMCGDSTKIDDVEKLMNGQKADMVFTSPPYNANTKAGQGDIFNGKEGKKLYDNGYKDNLDTNTYIDFAKSVLENCFLFTDGFIFWNVSYNANAKYEYLKQIENRIDYLVEQICWKKSSAIPFKGMLRRAWEPIFLFSTSKISLGTEKVETNLWEVSNTDSQQKNHKACFPVALVVKGIELVKNSNILLDPFCGSGSTLIACEQTNRICYGMELDPKYCDVIRKRYAKFINKEEEWQNITKKL